jgi:hypothetical protein
MFVANDNRWRRNLLLHADFWQTALRRFNFRSLTATTASAGFLLSWGQHIDILGGRDEVHALEARLRSYDLASCKR